VQDFKNFFRKNFLLDKKLQIGSFRIFWLFIPKTNNFFVLLLEMQYFFEPIDFGQAQKVHYSIASFTAALLTTAIVYLGALAGNMALLVAVITSTATTASTSTASTESASTTISAAISAAKASAASTATTESATTSAASTAKATGAKSAIAVATTASAATTTTTTVSTGVGRVHLDLLAIDNHAVELLDGGLSTIVVSHCYESIALLGDVNIGDFATTIYFLKREEKFNKMPIAIFGSS
jgi:hypothetical protein